MTCLSVVILLFTPLIKEEEEKSAQSVAEEIQHSIMQVFVDSYVKTSGENSADHKEKVERVNKWKNDHPAPTDVNESEDSD